MGIQGWWVSKGGYWPTWLLSVVNVLRVVIHSWRSCESLHFVLIYYILSSESLCVVIHYIRRTPYSKWLHPPPPPRTPGCSYTLVAALSLRLLNALNSEDRGLKLRFSLAMIVFETFELILCQMLSSQGKNALSNPYPHYLVRLATSRFRSFVCVAGVSQLPPPPQGPRRAPSRTPLWGGCR